jgi:cyclic pyranopterin phosphate synthase
MEELIAFSIKNKKKIRAGMETLEDLNNPILNQDNRSMIAIGG